MSSTTDLLRRLADERPQDFDLRLQLAQLLREEGSLQDAAKYVAEAEALRPNDAVALSLSGAVLHSFGRDQEAVQKLTKSLQLRPDAKTRIVLARVQLALGDAAAAESTYFDAVQADPAVADIELLTAIQQPKPLATTTAMPVRPKVPVAASTPQGLTSDAMQFESERPRTSFGDVGGMDDVKDDLRMQIILPLQKPDLFRSYGKSVGGGILMFGPPGCGKSYIARALAGECSAAYFQVGISDIFDKWLGNSEKNIHSLFEQARREAPSIIFLDEIDVVGGKRDVSPSVASLRGTINQLLMEMDNLASLEKPVLAIGATNTPWSVDTALKRPGRFDRVVFVPPPDEAARQEILRLHLRGKPADGVDVNKVAGRMKLFSGADIRAVVDRAVEAALKVAMRTGTQQPVTTAMLMDAVTNTQPSTTEWLQTVRDYVKYGNDGGFYDAVAKYLKSIG